MLVRKYIQQRLQEYYAQPFDRVIGSLISPIPFRFLFGEFHWKYVYGKAYRRTKGQWLTPSELFTPYYSQCIARWMIQQIQWKRSQTQASFVNIEIVEMGGGRGTNAMNILDYIHQWFPEDIYNCIASYTIIDYSEPLLEYQKQKFSTTFHASLFCNRNLDLCRYATTMPFDAAQCSLFSTAPSSRKSCSETITFVLGLELLDNLPHDKIRYSIRTGLLEQVELLNADDEINLSTKEVFVPLADPMLQHVLRYYPIVPSSETQCYWIPTVACGIIHSILQERPHAIILFADFDGFSASSLATRAPSASVAATDSGIDTHVPLPAVGDPIVTDMNDVDLSSYLQASETATDILFPTNFPALASFVHATQQTANPRSAHTSSVSGRMTPEGTTALVQKQSAFLQRHGPDQVQSTTSWWTGYSPMIHDFENCSILTFGLPDPSPENGRSNSKRPSSV